MDSKSLKKHAHICHCLNKKHFDEDAHIAAAITSLLWITQDQGDRAAMSNKDAINEVGCIADLGTKLGWEINSAAILIEAAKASKTVAKGKIKAGDTLKSKPKKDAPYGVNAWGKPHTSLAARKKDAPKTSKKSTKPKKDATLSDIASKLKNNCFPKTEAAIAKAQAAANAPIPKSDEVATLKGEIAELKSMMAALIAAQK